MASISSSYPSYGTISEENDAIVQMEAPSNVEDHSSELKRMRLKEISYKVALATSIASFFVFQTICSEYVYHFNPTAQDSDTQTQKILRIFASGVIGFMTGMFVDYYETHKPFAARTFKNMACITIPAITFNTIRNILQCANDPNLAKCELDTLLASQVNTMMAVTGMIAIKTLYLTWPFKKNRP